jgi:DNA-binding NtrC family response regulator
MEDITNVIPQVRRLILRRLAVHVNGAGGPRSFAVDRDVMRIGSHARNDVVLTDDTVSRSHAEIVRTPSGVLLRDLDSTNGTHVGPLRIREIWLQDGQAFRVGRTELVFHSGDETVDILPSESEGLEGLVGRSMAMRATFAVVERVAPTDLTVLVTGETGTGKELVSRALHARSPRRDRPFEVFDGGAVAANLVESELFGHVKGSFTGAVRDRAGVFESAQGGTVFLDEIGELPLGAQASLLRVLEQREVRRVGAREVRPVDVRVVAATNRDLRAEVEAGRFREDLYYRLAVVELTLPPLRDRLEDLPLIARHILRNAGFAHAVRDLDPQVVQALAAWRWPGNVRELRNVLLRAIPFTSGSTLGLDALPDALRARHDPRPDDDIDPGIPMPAADLQFHDAKDRLLEAFERHYLQSLLDRAEGNLSRAARLAGVDRKTIGRMLKRHGMAESPR